MHENGADRFADVRGFLDRMAMDVQPEPSGVRPTVRRARRRLAAASVAGALVLIAVGYGALASVDAIRSFNRHVPAAPSTAAPTAPLPQIGDHRAELAPIVLRRGDVPDGLSAGGGDPTAAGDIAPVFGVSNEELAIGYVDGFSTFFEHRWEAATGRRADLVSTAMLYESPNAAHRAFRLAVRGPLADDLTFESWKTSRTSGLGDEAYVSTGRYNGDPAIGYVWRRGDLLLFLGSQGIPDRCRRRSCTGSRSRWTSAGRSRTARSRTRGRGRAPRSFGGSTHPAGVGPAPRRRPGGCCARHRPDPARRTNLSGGRRRSRQTRVSRSTTSQGGFDLGGDRALGTFG